MAKVRNDEKPKKQILDQTVKCGKTILLKEARLPKQVIDRNF